MSSPPPFLDDVVAQRSVTPNLTLLDTTHDPVQQQQVHWSQMLYECDVIARVDGSFEFIFEGGSDNGEFPFFGSNYSVHHNISKGDILLEIQGQKVAGYTQRDVIALLTLHCSRNGISIKLKAVKAGYLTKDLRQYLNTRFQKGSMDHDLQNTIRDNLYLRTVPCTTRLPRCSEINGVDYTFLSVEEFIALERSGNLLESGIYEDNLYGTPRPAPAASAFSASVSNSAQSSGWPIKSNHYGGTRSMKEASHSPAKRNNSVGLIMPGAHASSEGKRRRNRSNVEAMASKTTDISDYPSLSPYTRSSTPVASVHSVANYNQSQFSPFSSNVLFHQDVPAAVSENLRHAYMDNGQAYFYVNHDGSRWLDPPFSQVPSSNFDGCDNDLPFGWERIDDPHYGTYYIDHVNRRTQYENPVLHAGTLDQIASSPRGFSSRSLSWNSKSEQRSDNSRSSGPLSPGSETKISPRTSRNSSLTQATNGSNARDSSTPANGSSESPLIDGSSSLQPVATSSNPLSSSPASTHRFPYLHCIPCLNEKHNPTKHQLPDSAKTDTTHLSNDTVTSNTGIDGDQQTPLLPESLCQTHFNSLTQASDTAYRDFSRPSSLTGCNTVPKQPAFFTRNPDELRGILILISLMKSSRGLGFTIIGGDNSMSQEFLQVKDVVPYGPAWCDGKLQTGDVLVHVNNICVLGYSHKDIISLFQSTPPGEMVQLEVCRGYPLPFDPSDPDTEIVTTVAVSVANAKASDCQNVYSVSQYSKNSKVMTSTNGKFVDPMNRATKSMPDLSSKQSLHGNQQTPNGVISTSVPSDGSTKLCSSSTSGAPESHSVGITKGTAGFGFTIADSSYGQKVKKILDQPRCKQLQEGDVLTDINGQSVQNLSHAEVVQILKDCPCGDTAQIAVQRNGVMLPVRSKMKNKVKSADDFNNNSRGDASETVFFPHQSFSLDTKDDKVFYNYRSKTPTAELYSSRDKDPVVVPRPKTPLVDSRNWAKSFAETAIVSGSTERQNSVFGNGASRYKDKSDFKLNSEQLDRETTDYLSNEPSYKSQTNHNTWYSNKTHHRPVKNRHFSDSDFAQNSEALDNMNVLSLGKQYNYNTSSHFAKPSQLLEQSFTSSKQHSFGEHGVSKNCDDSSVCDDIELSNFKYSYEGGYHANSKPTFASDSGGNTYYDSSKPNVHNSFSLYNAHHQPQLNFQPMNSSHSTTAQSVSWNGGGLAKELSPLNSSLLHGRDYLSRKHGTSFEHEHPVPYNSQVPLHNTATAASKTFNTHPNQSSTDGFVDVTLTLFRQSSGFGFRVVGGTEEGSQVCVGHIVTGGAADLDGRLVTGDEILGIDGQCVMNSSHQHVVQLMNSAAANGKVTLHIRRPSTENASDSKNYSLPHEVSLHRKENEGFGFVLISSLNRKGSDIGRITEGSPADLCGQLHVGDVIQGVNGISILDMPHGDIVGLIKDSGYSITLSVCLAQDSTSSVTSAASQKEDESSLLDPDDSFHSIELQRGVKGFGFSIRGGKEFHNMPLFVLRIAENGPAHHDGRIKVGDQIMEINGVSTKLMTHADAIELIREGGSAVRLLVKRNSQPTPATTGLYQKLMHTSPSIHFSPASDEGAGQTTS